MLALPADSFVAVPCGYAEAQAKEPGPAWFCRVPYRLPDMRRDRAWIADAAIQGPSPDRAAALFSAGRRASRAQAIQVVEDSSGSCQATNSRRCGPIRLPL